MKLTLTQQLREWANCVYADDSPALAATMREAADLLDQNEEDLAAYAVMIANERDRANVRDFDDCDVAYSGGGR
jgi:hypothetical protein